MSLHCPRCETPMYDNGRPGWATCLNCGTMQVKHLDRIPARPLPGTRIDAPKTGASGTELPRPSIRAAASPHENAGPTPATGHQPESDARS